MVLNNSFFLSSSGLFDFDMTFLSQALLFLILSISVTKLFLQPISKQIEDRNAYINYSLRKLDIFVSLAYEKLEDSIQLIIQEKKELNRQTALVKSYLKTKFENKIEEIQKENKSLLSKVKVSLTIKSLEKVSSLNKSINDIAESFFKNKISFQ